MQSSGCLPSRSQARPATWRRTAWHRTPAPPAAVLAPPASHSHVTARSRVSQRQELSAAPKEPRRQQRLERCCTGRGDVHVACTQPVSSCKLAQKPARDCRITCMAACVVLQPGGEQRSGLRYLVASDRSNRLTSAQVLAPRSSMVTRMLPEQIESWDLIELPVDTLLPVQDSAPEASLSIFLSCSSRRRSQALVLA